jgi:hypothetical protein
MERRSRVTAVPASRTKRSLFENGAEVPEEAMRQYVSVASCHSINVELLDLTYTVRGLAPAPVLRVAHGPKAQNYSRTFGGREAERKLILVLRTVNGGELELSAEFLSSLVPSERTLLWAVCAIASLCEAPALVDLSIRNRQNPLGVLHARGAEWVVGFAQWLKARYHQIVDVDEFDGLITVYDAKSTASGLRSHPGAGVGLWPGRGRVSRIQDVEGAMGPRHDDRSVRRTATLIFADGSSKRDAVVDEHLSGMAALVPSLLIHMSPDLLADLSVTFGPEDALRQVRDRGPSWARAFTEHVCARGKLISTTREWEATMRGFDELQSGGSCVSAGFHTPGSGAGYSARAASVSQWVVEAIDRLCGAKARGPSVDLFRALTRRDAGAGLAAEDIEEFARTALPANSSVERVELRKDGKVRIILKDPVQPYMIARRGRTYIEDPVGSMIADMRVHAFDLDFRNGNQSGFPDAIAYRDKACKSLAQHTNISQAQGRVCLGNINVKMTPAAIQARGGIAMPSIGDFVQMLRQCNLDSAYNSSRSFVLKKERQVTDAVWNCNGPWSIPGLRLVPLEVSLDLSKLPEDRFATPGGDVGVATVAAIDPAEGETFESPEDPEGAET